MEIREYAPISQAAGPNEWNDNVQVSTTPDIFGSVADDSDATYTELTGWRDTSDIHHSDLLTCYFAPIDPDEFIPQWMHMMVRVMNPAEFSSNVLGESGFSDFLFVTEYRRADDTTGSGSPWDAWQVNAVGSSQGSEMPAGLLTEPTWYRFYQLASSTDKVIDPALPPDADHWRLVDAVEEQWAWESLTGPGLRFDMFGQQSSVEEPPRAWLDVFEVRLIVAGDVPGAIFGIPPLRQVQRGDGLGFSSAPRAIQNNSVQGSLRNFGFN